MDNEKINLIGRLTIVGLITLGGIYCACTGKEEIAGVFSIVGVWFWIISSED